MAGSVNRKRLVMPEAVAFRWAAFLLHAKDLDGILHSVLPKVHHTGEMKSSCGRFVGPWASPQTVSQGSCFISFMKTIKSRCRTGWVAIETLFADRAAFHWPNICFSAEDQQFPSPPKLCKDAAWPIPKCHRWSCRPPVPPAATHLALDFTDHSISYILGELGNRS